MNAVLRFNAVSNFTYTIVYGDTVTAMWQPLQSFSATPTNRMIEISVPPANDSRFYRLHLP
jgi:hypothetical protein